MSVACEQGVGADFVVRGQVVGVSEAAEPPENFEISFEADDEDQREDGEPDEGGSMQVRMTQRTADLGDCRVDGDTVTIFWTNQTDFDPASTVGDDRFPDNLQGATVDVDGRAFSSDGEDDECAFVADAVQIEAGAGATLSPGGIPGGGVTPEPTSAPATTAPSPATTAPAATATAAVVTPTP
jgi:hypothetical protein